MAPWGSSCMFATVVADTCAMIVKGEETARAGASDAHPLEASGALSSTVMLPLRGGPFLYTTSRPGPVPHPSARSAMLHGYVSTSAIAAAGTSADGARVYALGSAYAALRQGRKVPQASTSDTASRSTSTSVHAGYSSVLSTPWAHLSCRCGGLNQVVQNRWPWGHPQMSQGMSSNSEGYR